MTRLNVHGIGFTLFLALLTVLPPLAIDMALPSLPLIQADLHAAQTEAAAAIAIFIAGFSTAPIAVGPLTDRFGRKAVMSLGLVIFTLSAAGAVVAPSIGVLLALRVVQGASAGPVGIRRGRSSATCSKAGKRACSLPRSRSCSASARWSLRRWARRFCTSAPGA